MKAIQYADRAKHFHKPGTERLTRYEFACGYVQRAESPGGCTVSSGVQLTLWHEGTFHVRAHDFAEHKRLFWDVFETMTEANRRYFQAKRQLGLVATPRS
jgi:hypothetical protein